MQIFRCPLRPLIHHMCAIFPALVETFVKHEGRLKKRQIQNNIQHEHHITLPLRGGTDTLHRLIIARGATNCLTEPGHPPVFRAG